MITGGDAGAAVAGDEVFLMIPVPANIKVSLATGVTGMRKGSAGLSAMPESILQEDPFSVHSFAFRGPLGDPIKVIGVMARNHVSCPSDLSAGVSFGSHRRNAKLGRR